MWGSMSACVWCLARVCAPRDNPSRHKKTYRLVKFQRLAVARLKDENVAHFVCDSLKENPTTKLQENSRDGVQNEGWWSSWVCGGG
jgi:hypothetical protein